jgi:XRE family transcriptional regulator, regulator of sulfur utilization
MPPSRALLAKNLKKLRALRGIDQESLAAQIGMSRGFLSSIERGQKAATIDTLARLAEGLGVPIARLLEDSRVVSED